ncbi:MAG TPA: hypothetical protein DIT99_18520 [Candidatus Latescibacteria bacterium]|nr:hypothetical protein [Candidatus Latescibacterota bacterium]
MLLLLSMLESQWYQFSGQKNEYGDRQVAEEEDQIEISDVQESLDSVEKMERAALRRAIPPLWLGASIALLAGALVALSVADLREYHVYIILFMAFVLVYKAQTTGVSVRQFPSKLTAIALGILIPLFFLLVVGGQALTGFLGSVWAPLSAGGILAMTVFALSLFERRWHLTRIGVEEGE